MLFQKLPAIFVLLPLKLLHFVHVYLFSLTLQVVLSCAILATVFVVPKTPENNCILNYDRKD